MMSKTFDCAECGASAPYGRLSCPSCGALLASVTGALKPALRAAEVEAQPDRRSESEPIAVTGSVAVAEAPGTGANNGKTRRRTASLARSPIHRLPRRQRHRCTGRGAGSDSCAAVPVSAPKPAQPLGRWRAEPDADPSRCSAGHGEGATPAEPAPAASRPPTAPASTPAPTPAVAPKPGRTAHAPLRADAGGGRPSARCGRRRRAERARRRAHRPGRRRADRGRRRRARPRRRDARRRPPPRRQRHRPPHLPRRVAARRSEPRSCLCSSPRRSPRCRRRRGRRSSSLPRRSSDARISATSRRKPFR